MKIYKALIFSMGFMPHILPIKIYPEASFWMEWIAIVIALFILIISSWILSKWKIISECNKLHIPVSVVPFLMMFSVIILQYYFGLIENVNSALMTQFELAFCIVYIVVSFTLGRVSENYISSGVRFYAFGLIGALAFNFLAVLLERVGIVFSFNEYRYVAAGGRLVGFVGQSNQLSVLAVLAWFSILFLHLKGCVKDIFLYILGFSVFVVMAAAGSRAGYLIFFVLSTYWIYWSNKNLNSKFALFLISGCLANIIVIFCWNTLFADGNLIVERSLAIVGYSSRVEIWTDAFRLALRNPLLGVGFGDFAGARWMELSGLLNDINTHHAHNLIFHFLAEFGFLFSFIIIISIAYALWPTLYMVLRRELNLDQIYIASILFSIIGYSLFEYPLWYAYFLIPLCLMLALLDQKSLSFSFAFSGKKISSVIIFFVLILSLVTYNYYVIQSFYQRVARETANGSNIHLRTSDLKFMEVSEEDAMRASGLPFFKKYSNVMLTRTFENSKNMIEFKLALLRQAMLLDLNEETISRYLIYLVTYEQFYDACFIYKKLDRNLALKTNVKNRLKDASEYSSEIREFSDAKCLKFTYTK